MKKSSSRPSGLVSTQNAAAKRLGTTTKTLRAWRAEGAPGFAADGSIRLAELGAWVEARKKDKAGSADSKETKLMEEIRKLRIANDRQEGRVIERAIVAERIQRAAGELNSFRTKSEAEHPNRFASAAGDIALCRTIVRGIWDEIFAGMGTLAKHFEEGAR